MARWIERFAEYDFDIEHSPGKQHANADARSRYPVRVSAMAVPEIWFPPEFKADFVKQQAHDPITSALLAWCKMAQRPRQNQLEGEPQDLWYYWSRFYEITVKDSTLCLRTPVGDEPGITFRAIVPRAARQEILELAHGSRVSGHFGVQKIVDKLRQRFHWLKIAKDVKY